MYFAYHGRFTTCNLDTPHFAFRTNKMKLINKKMAISGPVHPEFEGVPVPIYLPFGFFPISDGRHSGLLPPAFNASPQYGLGLKDWVTIKCSMIISMSMVRGKFLFLWGMEFISHAGIQGPLPIIAAESIFTLQKTRILSNSVETGILMIQNLESYLGTYC